MGYSYRGREALPLRPPPEPQAPPVGNSRSAPAQYCVCALFLRDLLCRRCPAAQRFVVGEAGCSLSVLLTVEVEDVLAEGEEICWCSEM